MRENNGYSIHYTDFYPDPSTYSSSSPSSSLALSAIPPLLPHTLLYIALPSNPSFFGPQSPEKIADVIRRSEGISGPNFEYLFRLEDSLAELGPEAVDRHISGLVERVKGEGGEKGLEGKEERGGKGERGWGAKGENGGWGLKKSEGEGQEGSREGEKIESNDSWWWEKEK